MENNREQYEALKKREQYEQLKVRESAETKPDFSLTPSPMSAASTGIDVQSVEAPRPEMTIGAGESTPYISPMDKFRSLIGGLGTGVTMGLMDYQKDYPERTDPTLHGIGEFAGAFAPISAGMKVAAAPIKAIKSPLLKRLLTDVAGGALYESAIQGGRAVTGKEVDLKQIPITSGMFGGFGLGLKGLGKAAKHIAPKIKQRLKPKLPVKPSAVSPVERIPAKATPSMAKPKLAKKQEWEMTKEEFGNINQVNIERSQLARDRDVRKWIKRHDKPNVFHEAIDKAITRVNKESMVAKEHSFAVQQALKEGKPVPESVLKDYPDFVKQYKGGSYVGKTEKPILKPTEIIEKPSKLRRLKKEEKPEISVGQKEIKTGYNVSGDKIQFIKMTKVRGKKYFADRGFKQMPNPNYMQKGDTYVHYNSLDKTWHIEGKLLQPKKLIVGKKELALKKGVEKRIAAKKLAIEKSKGKEGIELAFIGFSPEAARGLSKTTIKGIRGASNLTSTIIEKAKVKPEIRRGVKEFKETAIEHDRQIRRSEITNRLLTKTVKDIVKKPDRQMLMVHAYEHKLSGKHWNQLNEIEKGVVRWAAKEKTKLNDFIKEHDVLETMNVKGINHIFHHWIDSKTGKPFKAMYGKFSKGLPQAKQRTIPTYETGIVKGLKPATTNLGELIGLEWESVMRAQQSRAMFKTVHNIFAEKDVGIQLRKGAPIKPIRMVERWDLLAKQGLTENYTRFEHYALDKPIVFKDASGKTAMIKGPVGVHNELYPHLKAYMDNPTYNAFDNLVSVSRSGKLGMSMFHAVSLGAQEAALSLGKLITGHPVAFARRVPFTAIPRGLRYRKTLGPVERLLYEEGLELHRHSEQMGAKEFFSGVGIPSKVGNVMTWPIKTSRDFIFGVVQPGMKTAFAHDTFLEMLPKYLKKTDWTKESVINAYEAGKPIPKEARKCARQAVQMADGHFSGEHWRRSLMETNRFMAKAYFSPTAQTAWNRGLLSKTWQREHMLVAKNVGKSFLPDRLIKKMSLAEIHPAAKAEYRQYLYGAIAIIGAVDLYNLMTTKQMDGESKHLWQNPEGKGFAVRAPWNEPDYTITTKDGKTKTIKGGPAYIRPLKSLFEVAEWVHHPFRKFSYKLSPWITAIIAQMPNNKYRNYEGMKDIPERTMDFMFDVFEPIAIDQLVAAIRGRKTPQAAILPAFGMPVSKSKPPTKEELKKLAWKRARE